jgi:hypothetical protein
MRINMKLANWVYMHFASIKDERDVKPDIITAGPVI